jgi:hypothetical protein
MTSPYIPGRYTAPTSGSGSQTFTGPAGQGLNNLKGCIGILMNEDSTGSEGVKNAANLSIGFASKTHESVAAGLAEKHNSITSSAYSRASDTSYMNLPRASDGGLKAEAEFDTFVGDDSMKVTWLDFAPGNFNIINTFIGGPHVSEAEAGTIEPSDLYSGDVTRTLYQRADQVFFISNERNFVYGGQADANAAFHFGSASFHYVDQPIAGQSGLAYTEDLVTQGSVNWSSKHNVSPGTAGKATASISERYIYQDKDLTWISAVPHDINSKELTLRSQGFVVPSSGDMEIGYLALEFVDPTSGNGQMQYDTKVVRAPSFGDVTWEPFDIAYESYVIGSTLSTIKEHVQTSPNDDAGSVGIGFANDYNSGNSGRAMSVAVSYDNKEGGSGGTDKTDSQTAFDANSIILPLADGSDQYSVSYRGEGVFTVDSVPGVSGDLAPYWLVVGAKSL